MATVVNGLDKGLSSAGDGVLVTGHDGRIALWNRAAERILGYSAREVTGRSCCEILQGIDNAGNEVCQRACEVASAARRGESVENLDLRTRTKAGGAVWLNVSTLALPSPDNLGRDVTVHMFRDVTAARELAKLVHDHADSSERDVSTPDVLTRREFDVLRLLDAGGNTKVCAEKLHVSPATIRNHVQNILGKLHVHSRLQAVAYAKAHRLV